MGQFKLVQKRNDANVKAFLTSIVPSNLSIGSYGGNAI